MNGERREEQIDVLIEIKFFLLNAQECAHELFKMVLIV
jgi:hypothetical protein